MGYHSTGKRRDMLILSKVDDMKRYASLSFKLEGHAVKCVTFGQLFVWTPYGVLPFAPVGPHTRLGPGATG